jgi:OOP family OmpA-OmpF porin
VVAKEVAVQDPDLVSSMLTAIQDFVRDSFGTGRGGTLDTLQVGDRSVWIEQGPKAFLAAVVRGTPPQDLKGDLREAIDTIHLEQEENLESFDGDTIPFEAVRYRLEECLQSQAKEPERKSSPILWVTLLLVLFLIGAWIVHTVKSYTGWKDYLAILHKEPGIVVTDHEKSRGKYHIFGLKDPFATDPMKLLLEAGLDPQRFVFHWEPYHSFHWAFTLKRSKQLLRPPENVTLGFQNGILYAKGAALDPWIQKTKNLAPTLPGVVYFNGDGVVNINQVMNPPETIRLTLNRGILWAQGEASHEWILGARNRSKEIPGIVGYRDHDVVDSDLKEMEQLKKGLEKRAILFRHGSSKIIPDQKKILESVSEELKRFIHLAGTLGIHPLIKILGHTDSTGPEKTNLGLSLKRAEQIHAFLVSKGFHENAFSTVGLAATDPLAEEISERDRALNRRVDFKIILPTK